MEDRGGAGTFLDVFGGLCQLLHFVLLELHELCELISVALILK